MVVVTGATGILGRVLILDLLKKGKKVRALKRRESNVAQVLNSFAYYPSFDQELLENLQWKDVDFEDFDSLAYALEGCEEVYHTAALVSFDPWDKKQLFESNVELTKRLLYTIAESDVKALLYVSSIATLDPLAEQKVLDETSEFNPKNEHSSYAITKHLAEMEVFRAAAEGLNVVVIQPGIILGSGEWERSSGALFSRYKSLEWIPPGSSNYVDVRDVSKAAIELMEKKAYGERFTLVAGSLSHERVSQMIRSFYGLGQAKVLPKGLFKEARVLSSLFSWLIPPLRWVNKANIEALTGGEEISSQKVKETLGMEFIPAEESLTEHLENYAREGKIL